MCNLLTYRICPIFQVSNVTGINLNLLRMFLNLLSGRMHCNQHKPAEFQIDETYSVPVSTHYDCQIPPPSKHETTCSLKNIFQLSQVSGDTANYLGQIPY